MEYGECGLARNLVVVEAWDGAKKRNRRKREVFRLFLNRMGKGARYCSFLSGFRYGAEVMPPYRAPPGFFWKESSGVTLYESCTHGCSAPCVVVKLISPDSMVMCGTSTVLPFTVCVEGGVLRCTRKVAVPLKVRALSVLN